MSPTLILGGARTPIGKFAGGLASFSATDLGGHAIGAALDATGVPAEQVDYVFMGQVLLAGEGQAPARAAAAKAGIPLSAPAATVNKVCLSGLNAVYLAGRMIAAGDADIVVAGGMESMSGAPYLVPGARAGLRAGDATLVDSMMHDGLTCAIEGRSMGLSTERHLAEIGGISRESQDAFAATSHERAARATKNGLLEREIAPVEVPQRRGEPITVTTDEGIRPDASAASLARLRPAFDPAGTVTPGNASQISDGASALVLASPTAAERLGATPVGELIAYGQVAGPDTSLLTQPAAAIEAALERTDAALRDIDVFEINEAFAAVVLASMAALGVPHDVVNPNGGAVALGHPIGASGNRVLLTLLGELRRRGGGLGAASLCGGGGQGDAALVRVPEVPSR
ncbi:MAG: acetyl-CoA C-acetyltransferase [Acidimicrobiia bacterium]|nr:acetyl-CoA C-acetyltransferase [Acidimicrobiia bacterium]MYB23901.1 acetyl-CoA C-acetyltransferase [Acidimicrobiia bacterium]